MKSGPARKVWLAAGASLAVSGGFAIVISLPDGGLVLWAGVGMVAVGSLALRFGLDRPEADGAATEAVAPRAGARADLEPELRESPPRRVAMTARGKTVVSAWMLALATFGTLAHQHFAQIPPPPSERLLRQVGLRSEATIHSREIRHFEGERKLYFIGYSFVTASGAPVRISRSVPPGAYKSLRDGTSTEVVYLRENPSNHYLPELTSPVSTRVVFFAGGLLLAAAGFAEAQRRLHRRLATSGAAVRGLTADVRRKGGVRAFLVRYEVGGQRRSVKARERNPNLRSGQLATVLYDPAAPGRAVVYRLALYRAQA